MIRSWAMGICMVAVAAAMLQFLIPKGSLAKLVKLVMGALTVCVLIAPVTSLIPEVSAQLDSAASREPDTALSQAVEGQYYEAAQLSVEGLVRAELKKQEIPCKDVSVLMDTGEDGSIHISKVLVTLPESHAGITGRVQQSLQTMLGLETEVKTDES